MVKKIVVTDPAVPKALDGGNKVIVHGDLQENSVWFLQTKVHHKN